MFELIFSSKNCFDLWIKLLPIKLKISVLFHFSNYQNVLKNEKFQFLKGKNFNLGFQIRWAEKHKETERLSNVHEINSFL